MKKILSVILIFSFAVFCKYFKEAGNDVPCGILKRVKIVNHSVIPPLSGYLNTWYSITIKDTLSNLDTLYIPYIAERDTIILNNQCYADIYYCNGKIDGLVGNKQINRSDAKIVDSLICVEK
ncbi:MAG: hypothetical protein GX640_06260 [Fibrobacter sp.]|nr:hypothetical protein [Fibrobacter sp.]